ncbi:MAG TPA: hypothetical protein VIY66_02925 [Candidatus Acidoferrales bacterium]
MDFVVDGVTQTVYSDIGIGPHPRNKTVVKIGLHAPSHHFPSNFLEVGLALGIVG